jgi:uncharacterized repeat protein (TIGR02543 family)
MLCLLAFASPFGVYVKNNLEQFTGEFIEAESEQGTPNAEYCDLTIIYDTADSGKVIENVEVELKKYEQYGIPSPPVDGYVPDIKTVEGTITEDTTVTVKYSRGNYSITYVTNNGSWDVELLNAESKLISDYTTYRYGDTKILLGADDIQRDSMTFLGWYEDEACKGPRVTQINPTDFGNKIYYAKWSSDVYNITYIMNDTDGTYYYCANEYNAGSVAGWDSVVTDAEGNLKPEFTTYTYGSQFKLPTTVHKFGYTFIGWSEYQDGEQAKDNYRTQITETDSGDITLYAHWKRNVYTITYHTDFIRPTGQQAYYEIKDSQYTILDSYGNTTNHAGYPLTYTYGDTIKLPTKIKLHGYDSSKPEDIVWYNKQTEKISIEPGGKDAGKVSGYPEDLIYKGIISPTTLGFVIGSTSTHAYDHTNLDLYVKPVPDKYKVEFDVNVNTNYPNKENITTCDPQYFLYDETKPLTENQFKVVGRTFLNWNTKPDGSCDTFEDQQTVSNLIDAYDEDHDGVVTLYAQWQVHKYRVKYDLNWQDDETTEPKKAEGGSYPNEATYDVPFYVTDPIRKGYEFVGWKAVNGLNASTALYGTERTIKSATTATPMTAATICAGPDGKVYFVNLTDVNDGEVTLQAQWKPGVKKYNIKYNTNEPNDCSSKAVLGEFAPTSATFDKDVLISHPTMLGYKFTGWTISGIDIDVDASGNRTFLNYYGDSAYTVVGKAIQPTKTLITTETLKNITATHFINLKESGTVTFTANWKPIQYIVAYDTNHKSNETSEPKKPNGEHYPSKEFVIYDKNLKVENPVREGYIFKGWKITGMSETSHYYGPTEYNVIDHTISPNTTKIDTTTLYLDAENKDISVYNFINLHCKEEEVVTFTADWKPITYNIVYDAKSSPHVTFESDNPIKATYDQGFKVSPPDTDAHYTFKGWKITGMSDGTKHYYGNTPYEISDHTVIPNTTCTTTTSLDCANASCFINLHNQQDATVIFTAITEPNVYEITLDKQGGTGGNNNVYEKYGTGFYFDRGCTNSTDKIIPPRKNHYTFQGYYTKPNGEGDKCVNTDGTIHVSNDFFKEDTTIYAHWTPNVYQITLDKQGGDKGDSQFFEKYGVSFYYDKGCGNATSKIAIPNKTHYTFLGYYTKPNGEGTKCVNTNGTIRVSNTFFTEDTIIYAHWTPNVYKITLDKNGGRVGDNAFYEKYGVGYYYDVACAVPTKTIHPPKRDGYIFKGYFTSATSPCPANCTHTFGRVIDATGKIETIDNPKYYTKDTTIYAHWAKASHTVTLDKQGGTGGMDKFWVKTDVAAYSDNACTTEITAITTPTKKGYEFRGYYTKPNGQGKKYVEYHPNGQLSVINNLTDDDGYLIPDITVITKDITLYANWIPITYNIVYDLDGGTHGTNHPDKATYNVAFEVSHPTRTNYTFVGWNISGVCDCCHDVTSDDFNKTKETDFINLRCTKGTVKFKAVWNYTHTCTTSRSTSPAGCTSGGKIYKKYNCTDTTCPNYGKVAEEIENANAQPLGHKDTGDGTCMSHHHVDTHHNGRYYTDGNHERTHESWWTWTCSSAHDIRNGLEDVSGYTTAYCSRVTDFVDNVNYSKLGGSGLYYCGYRDHDFCYLDGGFYQIPKYRFECAGKRADTSGKVIDKFVDKLNQLTSKESASSCEIYQYMIPNHKECTKGLNADAPVSRWNNCCTKSNCDGKHRSINIDKIKCASCAYLNEPPTPSKNFNCSKCNATIKYCSTCKIYTSGNPTKCSKCKTKF